jgi:hypothetical protein
MPARRIVIRDCLGACHLLSVRPTKVGVWIRILFYGGQTLDYRFADLRSLFLIRYVLTAALEAELPAELWALIEAAAASALSQHQG